MIIILFFFFFNDPATTEIYTTEDTLSLHDALPISVPAPANPAPPGHVRPRPGTRSEEHTSELQSPSVISYAVFCLKKKKRSPRQPYPNPAHKHIKHKLKLALQ